MATTKRERDRRIEKIEGQLADAATTAEVGEWSVEHREAAPEERPEGMAYDVEERTIAYDFWQAQDDCLDHLASDEEDIVAFLGGYRSGKTVTGARWVLTGALALAGSRWLAMGQDYTKATGTTYRTLFESLPGERTHVVTSSFNGPEESPIVEDYNRQEHRLTLFNDSVIVLGSADKWSRYAGDEYSGIWLDEPSHYGSELHDLMEMMGTRLTADTGPKVMFWTLTGNGYNASWEVLEKREDSDGNPLGTRIVVERASVLENPYIAEEDKERLRRQFEGGGREEQALHGGFAAATGLVYSNFSRDMHVIPHAEAREHVDETDEWRAYGYDAGWNDPRVLVEVGKTPYDQLVVLDEFVESGAHVEDAIRWLEENDKPRGTIFAEHEPADIEKFKRADWPAVKADKSLDAGISEVRKRLEADGNMELPEGDSSGAFIVSNNGPTAGSFGTPANRGGRSGGGWGGTSTGTWGTGRRTTEDVSDSEEESGETEKRPRVGLLISDQCENLIREFLGYKEEQVGKSSAVDHALDSLRYCVATAGNRGDEKRAITGTWG
ncbi:hypothetical protein [Halococcus thailandensis]|uniref:hypothetical protein n=1 Tax=Halococcus thailandensis TaxID=335952 RepID=UPI0009B5C420|nr:hypothetical protein [Halococcus thailandensis]